jgi:hypothetical protein
MLLRTVSWNSYPNFVMEFTAHAHFLLQANRDDLKSRMTAEAIWDQKNRAGWRSVKRPQILSAKQEGCHH